MASYTVRARKHATLAAATVDSVTVTGPSPTLTVVNRDGAAEITFTVDGSTPVAGADETYVLPAAIGALTVDMPGGATATVKLISAGTPKYSVQVG